MAGPSDLTTYLDLARTAISAGDVTAARLNIALAKTVLAELPDTTANAVRISYTQSIAALDAALKDLIASTSGGVTVLGPEFL